MGSLAIAGFNIMLGISIFFINGNDYEDWLVIYPPATSAVICGAFLLYGAFNHRKKLTLLYLVFSVLSIVFYAVAAIVLFTLSHRIGTSIGVVFLIIAAMKIYFWFCVFNFHKRLESGLE